MERLKHMEEVLMGCVQAQLSHLDTVDTEELGQAISGSNSYLWIGNNF